MVRQDKSRPGRVTPKGGGETASAAAEGGATAGAGSGGSASVRRQPVKVDSRWSTLVPILMAVFMVAGTLLIMVNYIFLESPSNWNLLGGLGLILAGIIAATQWR